MKHTAARLSAAARREQNTKLLYEMNTRLNEGRSTIISTNCGFEELRRKYGPQICSRLEGEYLLLSFSGRDIRLLRKERGT